MIPQTKSTTADPTADTRPNLKVELWETEKPKRNKPKFRRFFFLGCSIMGGILIACLFIGIVYFLFPARVSFLILGIDRSPAGTSLGRSDTNILVTVLPLRPYVGILSIPRDLWVEIPGFGENRINTAHFFAENQLAGSGPNSALNTLNHNFGLDVTHFLRIRFDGFVEIVDSAGGFALSLEEPMAGLPAGNHQLSGEETLAFVRDRQGTDDFFRMQQGQVFITQFFSQLINPLNWHKLPGVVGAISDSIDTNVPIWLWPRILFAYWRTGSGKLDDRVISRDMVNPFTTSEGAQVLLPEWSIITPVINEMFEQ